MKFGTKLLAAPLLTAAVALTSAALYGVFVQHEAAQDRSASAREASQSKALAQAQEQVSQARAEVFRTLTIIASLDDDKVKHFRAELARQLRGVQRAVAALPAQMGDDAEMTRLSASAVPQIVQYLARCDKAIDLSGMDPNIGIGAMRGAEESYLAVATALQGMSARNDVLETTRTEAAEARARTLALALGLAMLLVTGGALGFAWRMQRRVAAELLRAVQLTGAVADGDLSATAHSENRDEIGDLLRALHGMTERLNGSLLTVRLACDHIGHATHEIAAGNNDLSLRTEQTAGALQQTASSIEELTGTVRQTAESARTANRLAASACSVAQRGGAVVAQVVSTMNDINSSSRRIADIVGTIDGIAFQTNILALNAAVEAARAGEQGRGFAVVAREVRSLAQRSAAAAREIKGLIAASVERVDAGSKLVADAGSTMTEIVASVQRVSDLIAEISAAAGAQSAGIVQINTAVSELDGMTQQNAALVQESAAAAESLQQQAARLTEVVNRFQLVVGATTAVERPAPVAAALLSRARATSAAATRPGTPAPAGEDWERL